MPSHNNDPTHMCNLVADHYKYLNAKRWNKIAQTNGTCGSIYALGAGSLPFNSLVNTVWFYLTVVKSTLMRVDWLMNYFSD